MIDNLGGNYMKPNLHTWKLAELQKVPRGLIFSLQIATHSLTGCEMARGAAMLMLPGSLVAGSGTISVVRLSSAAGSGCSGNSSVVILSSVFSWGNMTCLLLNILTVWLHRWTGAGGLSYTCVPFKLPGGEKYKYITTYFIVDKSKHPHKCRRD